MPGFGKPVKRCSRLLLPFHGCSVFDLPVVQDFLMPLLIGLFSPVFSQYMSPFDSLFLPLAAAQPALMRHCGHQVDKHIIDGGYHGAGDRLGLRVQ